ncbi:MAG TPA: 16S rRNA (cytosine(1402)-N(4))-methyltransferase RsmH [Candidatus Paceibacterota bacterium]|nr:16S rRNA (cytosine(1402)-N(4))-methyltransferase RsmH [Candidatus Paceibacterota bacterium]
MEAKHDSVLLHEAIEALSVSPADTVVDATIGGAGHFRVLLEKLGPEGTLIGIDADADAIERAKEAATGATPRVELVHDNFRNLASVLEGKGIASIDRALFDLGWSGFHLASGRGFSFKAEEPLLMTYGDPVDTMSAADLVNDLSEESLADLIYTLGEERFSRGIARSIVAAREKDRIETTTQLVAAIEAGVPGWYRARRIHPATKTFQALRIAVNDELGALREGLSAALASLSDGGRVALITFHSIEDRIVKQMLREAAHDGMGTVVTKKPIVPTSDELAANPRARSAKLRVFERSPRASTYMPRSTFALYA